MRNDWPVAGWIRHSGVQRYALEAAGILYICSEAPEVSACMTSGRCYRLQPDNDSGREVNARVRACTSSSGGRCSTSPNAPTSSVSPHLGVFRHTTAPQAAAAAAAAAAHSAALEEGRGAHCSHAQARRRTDALLIDPDVIIARLHLARCSVQRNGIHTYAHIYSAARRRRTDASACLNGSL